MKARSRGSRGSRPPRRRAPLARLRTRWSRTNTPAARGRALRRNRGDGRLRRAAGRAHRRAVPVPAEARGPARVLAAGDVLGEAVARDEAVALGVHRVDEQAEVRLVELDLVREQQRAELLLAELAERSASSSSKSLPQRASPPSASQRRSRSSSCVARTAHALREPRVRLELAGPRRVRAAAPPRSPCSSSSAHARGSAPAVKCRALASPAHGGHAALTSRSGSYGPTSIAASSVGASPRRTRLETGRPGRMSMSAAGIESSTAMSVSAPSSGGA